LKDTIESDLKKLNVEVVAGFIWLMVGTLWDFSFSQLWLWRMSSSEMWRCVHLVWTDVSEERIASELSLQPLAHAGSSLADFSPLKMEVIRPSDTSVHTRSTQRHIPEDGIHHSRDCFLAVVNTIMNRE
jgi:hypothetical protein